MRGTEMNTEYINMDKPELWERDVVESIKLYNAWYMAYTHEVYKKTQKRINQIVIKGVTDSKFFNDISPTMLKKSPSVLKIFRMITSPPLARERLAGLAGVPLSFIKTMENDNQLPTRLSQQEVWKNLSKIIDVIQKMLDTDLIPWVADGRSPLEEERQLLVGIITERLSSGDTDSYLRNVQEQRQLAIISKYLNAKGYKFSSTEKYNQMRSATYSYHTNIPVHDGIDVNITVDVVIKPKNAPVGEMPILIEAKSAGDFTNVNKRRKEEAKKMEQLRKTYGDDIKYYLFLGGYFNTNYLQYEASAGIDWIWEHRVSDLEKTGI